MQTKFNYTSGGEFKSNNGLTDYVGFFNIDDQGNAYTGKYYTVDSEVLTNPDSIYSSDYHRSLYFKDRYVYDTLTLPHTLDEILIQPNELVNFHTLNKKIEYLHNNLMYMYSKMFMGSTDVPFDQNTTTLGNLYGSDRFQWNSRLEVKNSQQYFSFKTLSSSPTLSAYGEFDKIKKFVVIPFKDKSGVSILAISDTQFMAITSVSTANGKLSSAQFVLYTDVIDNYSQEKCLNLEDIAHNDNFIYISDSKVNGTGQVFKYDISSYFENDEVFENKRFLVEAIGGYGNIDRKNKFNGPVTLGCRGNELWVYDSGNNGIKIYDGDFNWKLTLRLDSLKKYRILDIRHRKMNNHVYVLYENYLDKPFYGYFEYDENYKLVDTVVFEDLLYDATDGRFNRMSLSEQDSNVFYLTTNSTIYKKFFSKPEKTFAVFDRDLFFPDDLFGWNILDETWETIEKIWNANELYPSDFTIRDIFICDLNQNKDDFYILGDQYISHMNESTEYITILKDTSIPYYNYKSIKFENIEYNQSIILNKEFYKLFSNIIQFKNTLKGRFYAEYNKFGDLSYKDYIYLTDEEINTLNIELEYNSFINDNELVEPNVINRLFKKVYNFQTILLSISEVRIKNLKTWVDLQLGLNIYLIE